jgi:predicted PurR-regulated permease PerM
MNANPKTPTESQRQILWIALTGLAVATVIGLVAGGIWGLSRLLQILSPVLWPLAVAAVAACLLSPVVDFLERRRIPRVRAILLVFLAAFAVAGGVLASVVPQVIRETGQLAEKVPEYSQRLENSIAAFCAQPPEFLHHFWPAPTPDQPGPADKSETEKALGLGNVTQWLTGKLPMMGTWLLGQVGRLASGFGMLAGLVLIPVYTFYFLLEKRSIESQWRDYLPVRDSAAKAELVFVLESISQYLVAFFRGQVLVAMADAVLYTTGFLLAGLNYAFLLGFMALFLTMIPFLGAIVICLTALTLAFVQYGDGLHPLLVLAVFGAVQSLEGLFISPKIMGDRVGLHPLVIIIAVMTGTTLLGGILGGILAIPLAAALRVIMFRYVWKQRQATEAAA